MYDNSVRLIGFLGQNAEKRTARNKTPYVILSLATTVRWRGKESQENAERTEWHRLVAWGNLAKFASTLKRGNHISAEGELRYRMISDKEHPEVERRLAEIQRPQHPNPRMHQRPPIFCRHYQRLCSCLPLWCFMFCLGEAFDIIGCVFQG